jgi:hypothetical protein
MVAQGMGLSADQLLSSPLALIGTPDQCVTELGRRAKEWGVSQFVFSGALDLKQIERLSREVMAPAGK